ncbi:hypothetical protein VTP01DRAFT_7886 [Rhizomucor pusillus]|uniref:uncharacterized protein n=1 Tax=Rhizomucor pusillus TaxID=4840 RepID=UPI0037449BCD
MSEGYQDERLQSSRYSVIRWFGFDQFEPERAVTSYWVSSRVFLCIRIPLVLYSTVVMWADIGTTAQEGTFYKFFTYFTNLTFIGLHAYLVTALYHHVCYLLAKPHSPRSFFKQPPVLNYLYLYLYHSIVVFNIITPVVFWAALSKTMLTDPSSVPSMQWWTTTSVHGVSFFMMIVDVIFNRMKLYINMVLLVFINVVLYMFLTFIVHATNGFWVYPFLDWAQGPVTAGWYIGIGAAFIVVFFIQYAFHWFRGWLGRRFGRHPTPPPRQEMMEREQV